MAIKIPIYDRQVQETAQLSQPQQSSAPNPAAYGSDIAQATEKLGSAMGDLGSTLYAHLEKKREQEEERQVLEKDTARRIELQNALYSNETDDKGMPVGIMNRQKALATGATVEFDRKYQDISKKYVDAFQDERQKQLMAKLVSSQRDDLRGLVIKHEAGQFTEAYKSTLDDSMKTRIAGAALHQDPESLGRDVEEATQIASVGFSKLGDSPESIKQKSQALAGAMTKTAFDAQLEKNWKGAAALVEGMKDRLSPDAYADFQKTIEGKKLDDEQLGVWNSLKGAKLSDGTMDTATMEKSVMAMDMPTHRKEKIIDYVRAKAGEVDRQRKQRDDATDHSFKNELITGKQQGMVLDDALKMAAKYGGDPVAILDRQEIAKKLYTTEVKTDPYAYNGLWAGIQEGRFGAQEINRAFKENKLSGSDFQELTKLSYNSNHKFDEQDRKFVLDYVQDKAKGIGNKSKRDDYMYTVLRSSRGKNAQEVMKLASDMAQDDPTTSKWSILQDPVYEGKLKQSKAEDLVWGKFDEDMGRGTALEIGRAATFKGKKQWGPADVEEFAKAFGGYDKIKTGTAANQAIQKIREQNALSGKAFPVTVENVKAVINKFKLEDQK